jgi:hypothetical protein
LDKQRGFFAAFLAFLLLLLAWLAPITFSPGRK